MLAIFGFFFLLFGSSSILLITTGALDPQQWVPTPWDQVLIPFTQLDTSHGLSVVGICLGVSIISVVFLLIELRPPSTKVPVLMVEKDHLGQITASISSIRDLVNREATNIQGVQEIRTQVHNSSKGIHLQCRLSVAPHANTSQLGQQIQERVKRAVEHFLGKPVLGINVQTQIAPLTKHNKGVQSRVH